VIITAKAKFESNRRKSQLAGNRNEERLLRIIVLRSRVIIKGRVQCFSMQVVMNKCFLLNPEKILTQTRLVVFKKNAHFNFEE